MKLRDNSFGDLEYDLFWLGKVQLPFFEQLVEYDLIVDCAQDRKIQDFQRVTFAELVHHQKMYIA